MSKAAVRHETHPLRSVFNDAPRWQSRADKEERCATNHFKAHLLAELDEIDPQSQVCRARKIAKVLVDIACEGDIRAIREIMDRVEGKPTQALIGESLSTSSLNGPLSRRSRPTNGDKIWDGSRRRCFHRNRRRSKGRLANTPLCAK